MDYNKNVMERIFPLNEAARLLGVSTSTIRFWEKQKKIRCLRTVGGRRRVFESEIKRLRGDVVPPKEVKAALYGRVSSHEQKAKGDLERQLERLKTAAEELALGEPIFVFTDVASGLSDKRKGLSRLMELSAQGAITDVVITYKDRLTRFGFGYLEKYFESYGVKIHLVNGQADKKSLQDELVDDLLSIVTSFSGRLYGLRSHQKARSLVTVVKEAVASVNDDDNG